MNTTVRPSGDGWGLETPTDLGTVVSENGSFAARAGAAAITSRASAATIGRERIGRVSGDGGGTAPRTIPRRRSGSGGVARRSRDIPRPARPALDLDPVPEQAARDHQPLDLAGAFVDLHHPGVAVVALDRVLLHVAVAAVDLNRLVGDPGRRLAGVELGHRRLARERTPAVLEPGGALEQEPRRLQAPLHLGELELHRLDPRDRTAERLALLGVPHRLLERRAHHADRLGGHPDAAGVEHAHRDLEALAHGAQPLFDPDPPALAHQPP